ncbi:MAG: hypothetical protein MZU84_09440 [Sphingobacterium sp.]|nr:hypothetical protein [Sphingobacterium sp.]
MAKGLGVFKFAGQGWQECNSGLPVRPLINCVLADGSCLYAGIVRPWEMKGDLLHKPPVALGIFYSHDGGAHWHPAASSLRAWSFVDCLAAAGDRVFAGTSEHGILVSRDRGRNWQPFEPSLPTGRSVSHLIVRESRLYAVTDQAGVWRLPLSR